MLSQCARAPAKLNLFLHITGMRADGYHLLQSAFVMIDWCDELHVQVRPDPAITREDVAVQEALPAEDLIVRAARALQHAGDVRQGAHIRLIKNIPTQAGMGGGSSDAASTLLTLNRLWGLHWSLERLLPIGLQLGADVPFFLGGRSAWVEGVGEQLTPLPEIPELTRTRWIVIKPPQGVATATIFRHPELVRSTPRATISDFADAPLAFGRNDLQVVAQALCPEIKNTIEWLKGRGFQARMTGSGSALFAAVPDALSDADAQGVLDDFSSALRLQSAEGTMGWHMRICKVLDKHPDHGLQG